MSSRFIGAIGRGWLAEECYGYRSAPTIAACAMPYLYAKALLVASGGRAAPVAGLCNAHFAGSVDTDLMNFVAHYDASGATPSSLQQQGSAPSARLAPANARVVIYDAMTAAVAVDATTDAVASIAAELGVEPSMVEHIGDICAREASLEARRRKMLFGDDASIIA